METVIVLVFVVGYLCIAFEHSIKINKSASAILTGVICWTLFIVSTPSAEVLNSTPFADFVTHQKMEMGEKFALVNSHDIFIQFVGSELSSHLAAISEILFFLIGAMTIVELIDAHQGFRFITTRIKTKNPKSMLWIICWVTFFLSAILDNLTTTIVMVSPDWRCWTISAI